MDRQLFIALYVIACRSFKYHPGCKIVAPLDDIIREAEVAWASLPR